MSLLSVMQNRFFLLAAAMDNKTHTKPSKIHNVKQYLQYITLAQAVILLSGILIIHNTVCQFGVNSVIYHTAHPLVIFY